MYLDNQDLVDNYESVKQLVEHELNLMKFSEEELRKQEEERIKNGIQN